MGEQSGSWLFLVVGIAISAIALQGIVVFRRIKVSQNTTRPPAHLYPVVFPTWETNKVLWGGGVLNLLGLLLIGAGWFAQQEHIRQIRLLESEGVITMAQITNKTISSGEDGDNWYYIHYAFTAVMDDRQVEVNDESRVPMVFYDRFEHGDDLFVVYARSEPRIVRIQALYTPGKMDYRWLISLGGVGLFCCFLAWGVFSNYDNACVWTMKGFKQRSGCSNVILFVIRVGVRTMSPMICPASVRFVSV
jgi:hypothetical protein